MTCNGEPNVALKMAEAPVSPDVTRNGGAPQREHLAKQDDLGSVRSGRRPGAIFRLFARDGERDRALKIGEISSVFWRGWCHSGTH